LRSAQPLSMSRDRRWFGAPSHPRSPCTRCLTQSPRPSANLIGTPGVCAGIVPSREETPMAEITLAKALKVKNRLAGRLAKVQADIQAYNSVPAGQADQVNVPALK